MKQMVAECLYVVNPRNAFRPCAGNSDGRVLGAGGSVMGVLPSLVSLQLVLMMQIRHTAVQVEQICYWTRLQLPLTASSCDSFSANFDYFLCLKWEPVGRNLSMYWTIVFVFAACPSGKCDIHLRLHGL